MKLTFYCNADGMTSVGIQVGKGRLVPDSHPQISEILVFYLG
ncbi:MAG: hypothetical protein PWP64_1002 [Candidatus Cloacimonadota bacterium]|nr:hypothetical protein [Candidatus Cloacimonadota bacterium]